MDRDFVVDYLVDLLPTQDVFHFANTCRAVHNCVIRAVRRVIPLGHCIQRGRFHRRISRTTPNVVVPVTTDSLSRMRWLIHTSNRILSHVPYFYILAPRTNILYRGPYIPAHPTVPGVSLLDVCDDHGEWSVATFVRRDGDRILLRDPWDDACLSLSMKHRHGLHPLATRHGVACKNNFFVKRNGQKDTSA